jgi:hypothetical protein
MLPLSDSAGAAAPDVKAQKGGDYPGGIAWKKPDENALWKIEVHRDREPAHPGLGSQIRGVVVHQHGRQAMVIARYPEYAVEYWHDGQHAVVSVAGSGDVVEYVAPKKPSTSREKLPSEVLEVGSDFGGLARMSEWEWVRPEFFRGRFMLEGVAMLVFCQLEPSTGGKDSAAQSSPCGESSLGGGEVFPVEGASRAALVEERSRLPRVLQVGDELWQYSFHSGARPGLVFPEKVRRFFAGMAPYFAGTVPVP